MYSVFPHLEYTKLVKITTSLSVGLTLTFYFLKKCFYRITHQLRAFGYVLFKMADICMEDNL